MTIKEALKLVKEHSLIKVDYTTCIEFNDYFVFFTDPKALGNGIAINKSTKEIVGYKPWLIPIEEFKKGGKKYTISKKE